MAGEKENSAPILANLCKHLDFEPPAKLYGTYVGQVQNNATAPEAVIAEHRERLKKLLQDDRRGEHDPDNDVDVKSHRTAQETKRFEGEADWPKRDIEFFLDPHQCGQIKDLGYI